MYRSLILPHSCKSKLARCLPFALLASLAIPGCGHHHEHEVHSVAEPPTVQVAQPEIRDLAAVVGQPSFVEAYERTSVFPKLAGYIEKWYVDIGDTVKKDQVMADLFVPEIIEEWKRKGALVEFDRKRVKLAERTVDVAAADVEVAEATLKFAKATWEQYRKEVIRWASEVKRLQREVNRGVVDPQVLLESENRFRGSTAARDSAEADVAKAESNLESAKAALSEAQVAVKVAQADVDVADSDYKRLGAWADSEPGQKPYIKLYAPFDGVVVARNANTWDFVLPAAGDPSADHNAPFLSPSGQAAPVYVVERTDVVRIFVDIPEKDANFVHIGSKAMVLIKAYRDQPILGTVTRTSWALNVNSRTLRAEIDLPNTGSAIPNDLPESVREAVAQVKLPETTSQILPGMYAYGKVIIERPKVRALPVAALMRSGEKTFCWTIKDGKAVRTELQTGLSNGKWIEVINRRHAAGSQPAVHTVSLGGPVNALQGHASAMEAETATWSRFDGSEQVILGDLSLFTDGEPVHAASESDVVKDGADSHHSI